jgi:hypothetical protein
MVVPGLPLDHPAAARDDIFSGFTFRASNGELRVVVRDAVRPRPSADTIITPLGTSPRVMPPASLDWESLLAQATTWPTA